MTADHTRQSPEWYHMCYRNPERGARKLQRKQSIVTLGVNKVIIKPVHRGQTLNDSLPRLAGVKYLTLIDASSGHHNLKLDKKSSHLKTFCCPFGRYRYIRLPFRVALMGDLFQKKMDELFSGMSNVFVIADDILIAGFDELFKDHDETLEKMLQVCGQANLKLNED